MTITFKQFLSEAAVGKRPEFEKLKTKKAIAMLNKYCKDAIWMLQQNKPFWRGEQHLEHNIVTAGFVTVDPSKTERKSQNTDNYYTVLLDNNPLCKAFPKRSRSFIATTDRWNADAYSYGGTRFIMIPFDGVKIGAINDEDMWDTKIKMFGSSSSIDSYNGRWKRLGLKASVKSFEDFGKKLATSGDAKRKFRDEFGLTTDDQAEHFMENIWKAYGPESTGFTIHTTKDVQDAKGEVWVGGPVMYISMDMWDKMRNALYARDKDKKDESKYFD